MKKLSNEQVLQQANRLQQESQETVMRDIPQFQEATICKKDVRSPEAAVLHTLVFNMERGTHLTEILEFLRDCPDIQPYDVILANELDDRCGRSGNKDVAQEIAQALGMHYVYGLEFIELNEENCGYHGNAIFSRFPILSAKILRLPEEYNWYHDRQKRIGSRCAVLATLDVAGQKVGVASIHLENRTSGEGRKRQMEAVLEAAEQEFGNIPIILGGDYNTNTFDGRDKEAVIALAEHVSKLPNIAEIEQTEPMMQACGQRGYMWEVPTEYDGVTRRKPLPQGGHLSLQLDWIMARGLTLEGTKIISTLTKDMHFAAADGALARFTKPEISDHNAVWAKLSL